MFEQAYGRLVCFADGQREIIAMQWKQGATCAVHDHGATASGRVHLVVGALVEERFDFDGQGLCHVPDDCGAWIPEDAAAIVAIEPWSAP